MPLATLLLIGVLAGLVWGGMGDESPAGRLRAYLSLGGSFVSFLLALCAIFLPPRLAADLDSGRLTQVVTGPLPRWQLLVAWWLGTSAVLAALAVLGYALLGFGAEAVLRLSGDDAQAQKSLRENVLSARSVARADVPTTDDFEERAQARYQALLASGKLPPDLDEEEALGRLRSTFELEARSLGPRQGKSWSVPDANFGGTDQLVLGFKFNASWPKFIAANLRAVPLRITVSAGGKQLWVEPPNLYKPTSPFALTVPAELVAGHETLEVSIENLSSRGATLVFPREGPKFLYPAGGFARNLARAAWVEVCRLFFLVAIGVIMASLFDGKLATLAVLWVVALGYGQGFLDDSLRPGLFGAADQVILPLLRAVLWVIPDLGRAELGAALAGGEAVRPVWLIGSAQDLFLRTPVLLALGAFFFGRRELGANL